MTASCGRARWLTTRAPNRRGRRSRARRGAADVAADGAPRVEAGGRGGRGSADSGATSPDGKWTLLVRDGNVFVRPAAEADAAGEALTSRGTKEYPYSLNNIIWSPDSTKIAASRVVKTGDRRMVRYVESSPADQVQPKTFERFYAKPGDELDRQERGAHRRRRQARDRRSTRRSSRIRTTCRAIEWRRDSRALHVRVQPARPSALSRHRSRRRDRQRRGR